MSWVGTVAKLIGSAIGSFFASIFGSWLHDKKLVSAEDQKITGEQAEQTIKTVEKSNEARIEFDSGDLPPNVAKRVRGQYID